MMEIIFRVLVDDPAVAQLRRFAHRVMDMPYPFVPTPGTWVQLPSDVPFHHLGVSKVMDLILNLDGSVILDFSVDGLGEHSAEKQMATLSKAGYFEVGEPEPAE